MTVCVCDCVCVCVGFMVGLHACMCSVSSIARKMMGAAVFLNICSSETPPLRGVVEQQHGNMHYSVNAACWLTGMVLEGVSWGTAVVDRGTQMALHAVVGVLIAG